MGQYGEPLNEHATTPDGKSLARHRFSASNFCAQQGAPQPQGEGSTYKYGEPSGEEATKLGGKGRSRVMGRFAPSPTGPLHMGSLVAAVGSWLFARAAGGLWLVRMEDLDAPRVVPGMADDILRTLEALGLTWDGEVVRQSERHHLYREALDRLVSRGAAYPCGCTRADFAAAASAPHAGEEGPPYAGTCREGLPAGREPRAWRARVEDGREVSFDDLVLGHRSYRLDSLSGDFVVLRADGVFAYQLAVVVDDAAQGVTQVVRGADLITSTPRQIVIQGLLGYPRPEYAHLPLVTGPGGAKLSKRDNAVSLAKGVSVGGSLVALALAHLGQPVPEWAGEATAAQVLAWAVDRFDISAIPEG